MDDTSVAAGLMTVADDEDSEEANEADLCIITTAALIDNRNCDRLDDFFFEMND